MTEEEKTKLYEEFENRLGREFGWTAGFIITCYLLSDFTSWLLF